MFDNRLSTNPELVKHRICFTGHRPTKIRQSEEEIKRLLKNEILKGIDDGYYVFITGMCFGIDLWAAEIIIRLRSEGMRNLKLACVVPFYGCEKAWAPKWQKLFDDIARNSDFFTYCEMQYREGVFEQRNRWMIDRSARLIAVFNGSKSGTYNTIKYARIKGRETDIIKI